MTEEYKHTEASVCKRLDMRYSGNCRYRLSNAFIFRWESDFFVQKQNGYCYEIEVKISRADFFNDKKKVEKHGILQTGGYTWETTRYERNSEGKREQIKELVQRSAKRPNRFYYIVPDGLIQPHEVPPYAGLMYVPLNSFGDIQIVKEAPFLHKEVLEFEKSLCEKFYFYWRDRLTECESLRREVKRLRERILELDPPDPDLL